MTIIHIPQKQKTKKKKKRIIGFFEKGTFRYKGNVFKTKKKEESEVESEENKLEKINDYKKYMEYIESESKGINYDFFN